MGKQSGFLQRQRQREHEREMVVREIVGQFDADTIIITLNEQLGIGYDRMMRVLTRWTEIREAYIGALSQNKDKEGDVKQEKLDGAIRRIMKQAGREAAFQPFAQRYPQIAKETYGR